ncbi:MAG: DUF362 domain-containing protein, partial [Chloroflexi bacterium]|nr:DUF362 domain-containing protein [Chloroflexota bacterium]
MSASRSSVPGSGNPVRFSRREFVRRLAWLAAAAPGAAAVASALGCGTPAVPETPAAATLVTQATAPATAAAAAAATSAPVEAAVIATEVPTSAPAAAAAATGVPTAAAPTSAPAATGTALPAPAGVAYLAVARGASPAAITRAAIQALGGMERFCQSGYDVIIKPNICVAYNTFEYAATTNPEVVATLVELCLGAGASRVRVMDYPFGGTPEEAYRVSGIAAAVEAVGGEMEVMQALKYKDVEIPQGVDLQQCAMYQDALDADLLINVPIAKHHSMARLTLGMKNLMGLIQSRPQIHGSFRRRLPDIASVLAPELTVIDAVRILVAHGPTGGNLDDVRLTNTIIASHDMVAADAYATRLFDMKPADIPYIEGGAERGLGTLDLASV